MKSHYILTCFICFALLSSEGFATDEFAQQHSDMLAQYSAKKFYWNDNVGGDTVAVTRPVTRSTPTPTRTQPKTSSSPRVNIDLAKRYLKLGNSYRQLGNFDLAFHYIKLAQQTFIRQRNFDETYWYAASLEYLGYCHRDIGDNSQARSLLQQSLSIYQRIIKMEQGSQYAVREVIRNLEREIPTGAEKETITNPPNKKIIVVPPSPTPATITTNVRQVVYTEQCVCGYTPASQCICPPPLCSSCTPTEQNGDWGAVVNLDDRRLTRFPTDFKRERIDNISIVRNRFTNFPEEITRYSTLRVLNASFNRIRNFPDLSRLQNLEYLNFSDNRLIEVDGTIGKLKNLKYLNLSNNRQLKNISLDIGNLRNTLKELDIRNTKIDEGWIRQLIRELPNTNIIVGNEKKRSNSQNLSLDFNLYE